MGHKADRVDRRILQPGNPVLAQVDRTRAVPFPLGIFGGSMRYELGPVGDDTACPGERTVQSQRSLPVHWGRFDRLGS